MLVYNEHLLVNIHGMNIKENTRFMFSSFFSKIMSFMR